VGRFQGKQEKRPKGYGIVDDHSLTATQSFYEEGGSHTLVAATDALNYDALQNSRSSGPPQAISMFFAPVTSTIQTDTLLSQARNACMHIFESA
jgi:hypothetical protein